MLRHSFLRVGEDFPLQHILRPQCSFYPPSSYWVALSACLLARACIKRPDWSVSRKIYILIAFNKLCQISTRRRTFLGRGGVHWCGGCLAPPPEYKYPQIISDTLISNWSFFIAPTFWKLCDKSSHTAALFILQTCNKIKFSRGEICVANLKAPCKWCEFGQVLNGQFVKMGCWQMALNGLILKNFWSELFKIYFK